MSYSNHQSPVHRSSTTSQDKAPQHSHHHHDDDDRYHNNNHNSNSHFVSDSEERLTEALREAADSRMLLVSRLEENAKQSARQTEMVAQLIALHQTVSGMREREAELLEEIDVLKDELARVRSESQAQRERGGGSSPSLSNSQNQKSGRDLVMVVSENNNNNNNSSDSMMMTMVMSEEVRFELNRLRSENSALRTQCEFLSEEVKTTISLAAASQRRSAELSRMISADETK